MEANNEEKKIFAANLKAKVKLLGLTHQEAVDALAHEGINVKIETFRAWIYARSLPEVPTLLVMGDINWIDDIYLFCRKQCA
jgi:hypothetical protein